METADRGLDDGKAAAVSEPSTTSSSGTSVTANDTGLARARWGRRAAVAAGWGLAAILAFLAATEVLLRWALPPYHGRVPFDRGMRISATDDAREHAASAGATNALKIAIVGDSIAMGAGNQRYAPFGPALEWMLNVNKGVAPVRVDVYARPSATYEQKGMVAAAISNGARIVVMSCSLNDAEDWGRGGELMARRPDTRMPEMPAWVRPIVDRTATGRLVYDRLYRAKRDRAYRRYYQYLFTPGYSGQEKLHSAILEIGQLCRSNGVAVAGILFPLLNQDLRPGRYVPYERMHGTFAGFFAEARIPFLDLYPAYARCDPVRLQNVPMLDPHPSEIGHRIAAEALFAFLLEQRMIPPAYAPRRLKDENMIEGWKKKLRAVGQPLD